MQVGEVGQVRRNLRTRISQLGIGNGKPAFLEQDPRKLRGSLQWLRLGLETVGGAIETPIGRIIDLEWKSGRFMLCAPQTEWKL